MPRGRKPKNQVAVDSTIENTEIETKEIIRYAGETSINHIQNDDYCIIYAGERKWYNWVLQMLEEHPDEIEVLHHYDKEERSIEVKMPYAVMGYLRWPSKRNFTEEQKEAARKRLTKAREVKKESKERN